MITLYIKEYALKKGIKLTPTLLSRYKIKRTTARHILSGKAKSIPLDALYQLCLNLECTACDLLAYKPVDNKPLPDTHPLMKMYKPVAPISPPDIIKDLPPDKLEKVHAFIEKLRREK